MKISLKRLPEFSSLILNVIFILILSVIIISLNKGFDFTDEGGFLLSYSNVELYRGGIYNYHIIIDKLTGWFNPSILEYRWISLIITIISSIILTIGFRQWLRKTFQKDLLFPNFLFLFGFISIGNFLFYFPGLPTLYNNTLTNFILQVSTGLILYLFSIAPAFLISLNRNLFLLGILGFLCSFSFFIKFPTGILQICLYLILFLFYLRDQKIRVKFISLFSICTGAIGGFTIYFLFFQGADEWRINFLKELNILSDHSSLFLLKNYLFELYSVIKFSLKYFSWLVIFPLYFQVKDFFQKNFLLNKGKVRNVFIFFSVILISYQIYHFNFYRSLFRNQVWINAYFYLIVIGFQFILLLSIQYSKRSNKFNADKLIILLVLLLTPFIGAVGTANPIFANSLIHAAPWFCIILILTIDLSRHIKRIIIIPIFILIPGLVTSSQIVDGNLFVPYYSVFNKNQANFFDQKEKLKEIPLLDGILVDEETEKFLLELNQIFNESHFKKGDPIFGFHMPGVVYLMGGVSPGVPYYYDKHRDIKAIEYVRFGNSPPVILLTEGQSIDENLLEIMQIKGIKFPNEYVQKGKVYFPNTDSMLTVYFPINY